VRYREQLGHASPGARHALHAERLQQLMRSLDRLSRERLPQAMDLETERERRVRAISEVAGALAGSADGILEAAPEAELSESERADFERLAVQLRQRALERERDAPGLTDAQARSQLEAIDQTCASCHARFRPPGGPAAP
jgi:cytochrome c556